MTVFERNKDKDKFLNLTVFSCCLSDPVFEKFDKKAIDLVSVCKQEAFLNCNNHTWSPFLMVLSLSSATERCIATFYPDKPENKYCLIFNDKKIFPRNDLLRNISPINILFCSFNTKISEDQILKPNHFVPLFSRKISQENKNIIQHIPVKKRNILQSGFIYNFFRRSDKTFVLEAQ